jgi:hypothetical protein
LGGGDGVFNNTLSMKVNTAQNYNFNDGLGRIWKEDSLKNRDTIPQLAWENRVESQKA